MRLTRLVPSILLAILGILVFVMPVLASIPQPTDLEIQEVVAYENAKDDGDQLYLITYYIDFETLPSENADDLFIFRLLDEDDVEVASVEPYPFNDRGYGLGVVAFYLEPDEVPTWESGVTIQLLGNPLTEWIGGLPTTSTDIITWETGTIDDVQNLISAKVLSLALELGQAWDVAMTTTTQGVMALSDNGASYFLSIMPYLIEITPFLLGQYTFSPDYPDDKPSGNTYADQLLNAIDGTIFDLSGPANSLHVSRGTLTAALYYPFVVAFFILLAWKHRLNKGTTMLAWPFVILGAFIGVPLVVTILGGFICLVTTVWVFYKGATY